MAQRPKPSRVQRRHQQQQREQRRFDTMLQQIAQSFSCSAELARDFADQCALHRDNLAADLAFSDLALEVWTGRPGVEELLAVLQELRSTRQRHLDAIAAFVVQFEQLAEREPHVHLDKAVINAELVHRKIYPNPPAIP